MKKLLLLISLLAMFFVTACESVSLPSEDLTEVKEQIATINQQIEAMQKTLDLLKKTDDELKATIDGLKNSGGNEEVIAELQNKQKELENQMKSIEDAVKDTKDWASTTFATLEAQKELSETLASLSETVKTLQEEIGGIETLLGKMLEDCTASMQDWISDKLAGYCTLAEAQAAIESMKKEVADGDKTLQDEIEALEKELSEMEERLTEAYEKAIEEAFKNDGVIPPSADPDDTNKELEDLLAEVNAKIAVLENRVNEIDGKIASIKEQIAAMQATLELLKKADAELQATIELLKNSGNGGGNGSEGNVDAILELQKKQKELEEQMKSSEKTINDVKDWASTTFATLEQQKELSEILASLAETVKSLQGKVDGLETSLAEMIEECSASLKTWVNEQLSGYYTLAEAQAALAVLKAGITDGDKALQDEIDALEKELAEMEARITEAYKKAIEEAIKNNGTIPPTTDFEGEYGDLSAVIARIANLEKRLDEIEGQLTDLVNRVQSVNLMIPHGWDDEMYVVKPYPYYSNPVGTLRLDFAVSPKSAAKELADKFLDVISMQALEMKLEEMVGSWDESIEDGASNHPVTVGSYNIPLSACKADEKNGLLTIDIAVKDIPEELFLNYEMETASTIWMLNISDGYTQIQSVPFCVYALYSDVGYERYPDYDPYAVDRIGGTFKLNKADYGIADDEKIIDVRTSLDLYVNVDKWMTVSWDNTADYMTLTIDENKSGERSGTVVILTDKQHIDIYLKQYYEDWTLTSDKSELTFSANGGSENIMIYCHEDARLSHECDAEWIDVYGSYERYEIRAEPQETVTDESSREAIVTIRDNRGNSVDIKVVQNLLTIDEVTVKADRQEVILPYYGGTETVTLTHPKNAEIRVEGGWDFECQIIPVNETTSTLEITAIEPNREQEEARESTISLQLRLDGIYMETPVTEIKVAQAAITPEEATIKTDRSEVNLPYAGGRESITLTHPKNVDIRVDCDGDYFEHKIIPVNETTSTLEIIADENYYSETKTAIIKLQLDNFYFELPYTEIKVTQATRP